MGRPFSAIIRLTPEHKPEFDFGQSSNNGDGSAAGPIDFSAQQALAKCPVCGSGVFEDGMRYVCEKAVGTAPSCTFRTGKMILQQPVDHDQLRKLISQGKTDLLPKFISKKGRPFAAYLVLGEKGKVSFEFAPRPERAKKQTSKGEAAEAPPAAPIDFTGLEPIGKCPKCGGRVFETEKQYLCEKSQEKTKRCKFHAGRVILHQPLERDQMAKLLAEGRTGLLTQFISRAGRQFSAYLILAEDGKVGFEFPPR